MDRLATSDGRNDVVQNVFWYCSGSNANGNYGYCYGNTVFNPTELVDERFVEYDSLTEQQVIDWVKADLLDAGDLETVESCVTDGIASGRFSLRNQGLPW